MDITGSYSGLGPSAIMEGLDGNPSSNPQGGHLQKIDTLMKELKESGTIGGLGQMTPNSKDGQPWRVTETELPMDLWEAESYDENSRLQQTIAKNFLNLLHKQFSLKPNSLLLDIGSGNGRITNSILNTYADIQILGIDSSVDMVQYANENFGSARVKFRVDRAEELKTIQSTSVDAIASFSCLHWVFDQKSTFQRMYEVLKPSGWAGLMFAAETGFKDYLDDAFDKAMNEDPWRTYFETPAVQAGWNNAKPENIKKQVEEIGFQIVIMDVQNLDYYFENSKAFQNWILASAQQLKLLPQELQGGCAQRIAELYLEATFDRQPLDEQCIYQVDAFMLLLKKPKL